MASLRSQCLQAEALPKPSYSEPPNVHVLKGLVPSQVQLEELVGGSSGHSEHTLKGKSTFLYFSCGIM